MEYSNRPKGVILHDGSIIEADAVVVSLSPWSGQLPIQSASSQFSRLRISGVRARRIVIKP